MRHQPGSAGRPPPIVVTGVSGSGKSTVGAALARCLGVPFEDADDLHSAANVAKMATGEPLEDDDRRPWLDAVGEWLAQNPGGGVMSCSALKRTYRDQLRSHCPRVEFLQLSGSFELIGRRLNKRQGHFMPDSLLKSQFEALESLGHDELGVVVDIDVVDTTDAVLKTFLMRRSQQHQI